MILKLEEMFKVTKVSPGLSEWSLAAPVMSQCTNKQKWIQKLARNPELLVAGSICNHAAAWHAWGQSAWHDPSVDCWPDCWQVSSQISSCAKSKCRLHIRLIIEKWVSQDNRLHATTGCSVWCCYHWSSKLNRECWIRGKSLRHAVT